jgi:hypothetical protein
MRRDLVFEQLPASGLEHLAIEIEPDLVVADGVVVDFDLGGFRLRYAVRCDGGWRFLAAKIAVETGGTERNLEIVRDEPVGWRVDGVRRPDLADCVDIDMMGTPFTNTLPVRRLDFAERLPRRIAVAWIKIPDLTVRRTDQAYVLLGRTPSGRRFGYREPASGFLAEIEVDGDGLVIAYGDIWRRRAG